ncbi:MAG: DUF1569 domain-containing protein [Planctomycetaceae bacterium]
MPIDTAKVSGRRQLRFNSLDDILEEVDRLDQGEVVSIGNWSPGQNLKHLTILMVGCLDGIQVEVPLALRLAASLLKRRILSRPMTPGMQLPQAAAVLMPEETTWEEGVRGIRTALLRMKSEPERHAHPVFGALTRERWDQLHCRHSELHLSFLSPKVR